MVNKIVFFKNIQQNVSVYVFDSFRNNSQSYVNKKISNDEVIGALNFLIGKRIIKV